MFLIILIRRSIRLKKGSAGAGNSERKKSDQTETEEGNVQCTVQCIIYCTVCYSTVQYIILTHISDSSTKTLNTIHCFLYLT